MALFNKGQIKKWVGTCPPSSDAPVVAAYEQGLVYVKIFAVLMFAGSPMSTLTAKFKGFLYIDYNSA